MESEANREPATPASSESNTNPSFSKSEAIASLRDTIQQLEAVISQLDNDVSIEAISVESPIETLVTTTQELATAIAPSPQPSPNIPEVQPQTQTTTPLEPAPTISPEPIADSPKTATVPTPQPQKVRNNRVLIGAISALIIIGAGIFWWWLPQQPVTLLSQSEPSDTEITTSTELIEPETPISEQKSPDIPENIESLEDNPDLITDADSEAIIEVDIPAEITAPAAPKKIAIETVEPKIVLTPEQNLIAAIQNRVTEITQDYAEDLIVSVEADFTENSLSVILSNLWYELSESRQNKLANDILKRSRKLDFQKLAIENTEGDLIARNPVIGNTAIILHRTRE